MALPNGLIGNLSGPYEGRSHDNIMLHESSLLNDLRRFTWYNNQLLCIYREPAIVQTPLGLGGGELEFGSFEF